MPIWTSHAAARSRVASRFQVATWLTIISFGLCHGAWGQARRPPHDPRRAPVQVRTAAATSPSDNAGDSASQVVAVVNREPITRGELARECIRRFGETVLESEINKRLILEACNKAGVRVTNQEIEGEVQRMAGKFGLSVDRWLAMLQEERGISPEQYRRDVVWPMLSLRKLAAENLEITQAELDQSYESEYGEMVQVRMIASGTQARAEQLRRQVLKSPQHFDRLAKDYSEDENSASARGLIPPVRRHVGEPQVEKAVFALDEGELSPVVEAAGQFFIFRCERRIPPRDLDDNQKQQVMAQLRDALEDKKLRNVGNEIFRELQDKAKIVNVINDPKRKQEMPSVAALVNDQPVTLRHLGEQCVLRHGRPVLQAEVHRKLLNQALARRSLEVSKDDLQAEIRRAASSFGFLKDDGQPDVQKWLAHITKESEVSVDTYVRDVVWPSAALKKLVDSTVEITDGDLHKGFEANYGERVEVLAIVLSNQRTAHEVFDLARQNPTEKFFGELAHQYSIEPLSRANFGQVPPVRKWGGQPLVEQEAFQLKPGELSGVLAAGDKFVILRCIGRTKPVVRDLADVRTELEQDIREKKLRLAMNAEFERIRKSAQIDNFLDRSTQASAGEVRPAGYEGSRPQPGSRTSAPR